MMKIIEAGPLRSSHFAAVKYTYRDSQCIQHTTQIMTIKDDESGTILSCPGYEVFCAPYTGRKPIYSKLDPRPHLCYVANALNYIFKNNWWTYKIFSLDAVTIDMLYDVFDAYAYTPKRGTEFRSQESIDLYVSTVCSFFANMATVTPNAKIKPDSLFQEVKVLNKRAGDVQLMKIPIYRARSQASGESKLERDISPDALEILASLSEIHDPMLTFPIRAMQYTGMRLGEVVNMRQKNSPVSAVPGIEFRYHGDAVVGIKIDLRHEFELRSDGKPTGGIKKHRPVRVYPRFIRDFMVAYNNHTELLKSIKFEEAYCPMIINSSGKAMTADNLAKRFANLVKNHFVPTLLSSDNPYLVSYGMDIQNRNLTPHVLRHYFTVQLVLDGLSAETIAGYRGDRSSDSAKIYVRNKGAFLDKLHKIHNRLVEDMTRGGEPIL